MSRGLVILAAVETTEMERGIPEVSLIDSLVVRCRRYRRQGAMVANAVVSVVAEVPFTHLR
jgi:hypothetical protein